MAKFPMTAAIRVLRRANIDFDQHLYAYQERGGTKVSAAALQVPEAQVIKTLVMETDAGKPLIALMNGSRQVSTKALARLMGVKTVRPCLPGVAQKHSGYLVGGTSPFGTTKSMPVFVEQEILHFPTIWINGGKRGFLVSLDPQHLLDLLNPQVVSIGQA